MGANIPDFPVIAGGQIPQTLAPGVKAQTVLGCTVIGAGTGLRQVTLDSPNNGLSTTDIIVKHNPGFGTAPPAGGYTTAMSSLSAGVFTISIFDQTVIPPALIDGEVHFTVQRIPAVK